MYNYNNHLYTHCVHRPNILLLLVTTILTISSMYLHCTYTLLRAALLSFHQYQLYCFSQAFPHHTLTYGGYSHCPPTRFLMCGYSRPLPTSFLMAAALSLLPVAFMVGSGNKPPHRAAISISNSHLYYCVSPPFSGCRCS